MVKIIKLKEIKKNFSSHIENLQEICSEDISKTNHLIIEKLDSDVPLVKEIANYILISGGKRLRPLLTITCARMSGYGFNQNENRHINLAAAVEFIHTATLMHDDVVDESKIRRGNRLQMKYGAIKQVF